MPAKQKNSKTQAFEKCFELHTLGWKAFQNLAATIIGEVFGQTVQTFFDSRDGGRDGAFNGNWKPTASESFSGSFTVQCKFTAKLGKQLSLTDISGELEKAARLAQRGLADTYLLFTNAHITGSNDEKIREAITAIPGIRYYASYGLERISQIICESSRLRMLVPRVYGLGDLGQILDDRAYAQAREILSALGDDLGKFVITDAYKRSAHALVEHGFVLLLGEPACGKSTIAAALAVAATDEWGCSTIKIRGAGDFVKHSNPHEPKQFFWVDDAFGATQCDWQSTSDWNAAFPHIQAAIRRGARVVFTSRDYIYRNARRMLKETALPVIRESQVVIEVESLAPEEREQILYNHLRLGTQTLAKRTLLKPHLPSVASHHRFSPEIARRLGNPIFTNGLFISEAGLADFVERPLDFLCEVIRNLDSESRAALALVFMRAGALKSPLNLSTEERNALELMGGTIAGVREALKALQGSLVLLMVSGDEHLWKFKHPTIQDAFGRIIADDRELMDVYLVGTPLKTLFHEVTCGVGDIAGAKVNVPADRYETLARRIASLNLTKDDNKRSVHYFLSYRCDKRMLAAYILENPDFVERLHVGSYMSAVSEVRVLVRLQTFGLLPESKRQEIVAEIRDLAVSTPDAGFLNEEVRGLFSLEEFEDTLLEVRENLIPHLDDEIRSLRWNFGVNQGGNPEAHFEELVSALECFQQAFKTDVEAVRLISEALTCIKDVIEELQSELPEEPDYDDFRPSPRSESVDNGRRSIFDDVDQ